MIGGGSWATAIVKMLADNLTEKEIFWWMRNEEAIDHIKSFKHNPNYLSSVEIKVPANHISSNINEIVKKADYIVLNVPAAFLKDTLKDINADDFKGKKIISAIKGIVPEENLIIGEYINQKFGVPLSDILVISGPCHAEEVAMERLSYLTIACGDPDKAKTVAKNLSGNYIKTKITDDIIGTEYAAMLKNIYAIAAGMAHGLGYGDNFQSVLMSNGIREMKKFIKKVHKMKRNINDSAYLGDLLVTGYSIFSRNRMFGNMIGKGYTVKSAMMEMSMVAEGYYAAKSAYKLNQAYGAKTPIIDAVYSILYEGQEAKAVFKKLTDKLD